ncbi:hypothetical protein GCM10027020_29790 [Nocardioides salsibiostraticola]
MPGEPNAQPTNTSTISERSLDTHLDPDLDASAPAPVATLGELRTLLQRGAIGRALARAEADRDFPTFSSATDIHRAAVRTVILECRLARGDLLEAMAAGDELTEHLDTAGTAAGLALYGKGTLAAALGDPQQAADLFAAAGAHIGSDARMSMLIPWRTGASLALLHTRTGGAAALAADHLDLVVESGSKPALALALRTVAACDSGGRRVALLREALAAVEGATTERLTAQIATDLAEMLALSNEPGTHNETVQLLRQAEAYAGREQLWPLRARVRRVLDRLDEASAPVESERLSGLTKAERRVAELAAHGHSNRVIAERLDVGVKSVEWHLSRVYRKLGIRSRRGLAPLFGTTV